MRIVDLSFLPLPVWSRGELVGFVSVLKFEVSLCYYGQERESECVCVVVVVVSWCFESSQPRRITSGLNTNFTLSAGYSFHKSSYHKSCFFLAYLYSADTQHGNPHQVG